MKPSVQRLIVEKGDAIKCEARREGDGHAGYIVLAEGKSKRVLGHTDNRYKTAEDAVAYVEKTVADMRKGSEPKKKAPKKTKGEKS